MNGPLSGVVEENQGLEDYNPEAKKRKLSNENQMQKSLSNMGENQGLADYYSVAEKILINETEGRNHTKENIPKNESSILTNQHQPYSEFETENEVNLVENVEQRSGRIPVVSKKTFDPCFNSKPSSSKDFLRNDPLISNIGCNQINDENLQAINTDSTVKNKSQSYLSPLVFSSGFPHIAEQIFEQLDNKSLMNCREVSTSWQNCIGFKKSWDRIVKIPIILRGDKKTYTYFHVAARIKQHEIFKSILGSEEDKNPLMNQYGETLFHKVCENGGFKIAEVFVQKSFELNINLHINSGNSTPASLACKNGHKKILELLLQNSDRLKIDWNTRIDWMSNTAFLMACENGQSKIAEMMIQKSVQLKIDLNAKNRYGQSCFNIACINGHTRVAKLLLQKSVEYNIQTIPFKDSNAMCMKTPKKMKNVP